MNINGKPVKGLLSSHYSKVYAKCSTFCGRVDARDPSTRGELENSERVDVPGAGQLSKTNAGTITLRAWSPFSS